MSARTGRFDAEQLMWAAINAARDQGGGHGYNTVEVAVDALLSRPDVLQGLVEIAAEGVGAHA